MFGAVFARLEFKFVLFLVGNYNCDYLIMVSENWRRSSLLKGVNSKYIF